MIESLQNDKIKHLVKLTTDNRFRKNSALFAVEGAQENRRAPEFGYEVVEFFVCENLFKNELPDGKIHLVSEKVYEKIAYRGRSEGIIGIYREKQSELKKFTPAKHSTIIVLEGAEKPGNLGAVLRSCEAFGIDALIVTDEKTDFYNPNVIRSSVGCLFGMNIFSAMNQEAKDFLKGHGYRVFSTFMSETAVPIFKKDFNGNCAVVFGTEHSGLTDFWLKDSENTIIPMAGTIDSLNLSNAVAIACYEALRQKTS